MEKYKCEIWSFGRFFLEEWRNSYLGLFRIFVWIVIVGGDIGVYREVWEVLIIVGYIGFCKGVWEAVMFGYFDCEDWIFVIDWEVIVFYRDDFLRIIVRFFFVFLLLKFNLRLYRKGDYGKCELSIFFIG